MKKLIIFSFLAIGFLAGCNQKDIVDNAQQVGISKITHYITYTLTGGSTYTFPKGSAYVDPGYVAMEGTTVVTSKVVVTGTVNGNVVGLYHLTYSAVNADGLSSSTSRVVIVYDPTAPPTDLGGTYTCGIVRSPGGRTFVNLTASITKLAPGFFYCSDFFGGFYNLGSNYKYGPGGCMTGYFMLNANNTITVISSYVQIWSNSLTGLTNGVYTSATKTLVWDALWAGYDFKVTLVKN